MHHQHHTPSAGLCCGAADRLWLTRWRGEEEKGFYFGTNMDKWDDPDESPVGNGSSAVTAKL